ncbi:MAG TPA: signal peptidase I, partial [Gallionella sp.]|nr:signal peptidase I [Gallionella sp.]
MDFALILFVLLLVTGGVWLLDRFALAGKRGEGGAEPWWVEYAKSFFPVILIVFFIRSFLVEPFKIPSGSMIPTLQVGDFILVNKFTYGIRLPIVNKKLVQINNPQRGDVMVFHYPENPSLDYIKRVVGLPGDSVEYRNKRLWVNGVEQQQQPDGDYNYVETGLNFVHTEKRV